MRRFASLGAGLLLSSGVMACAPSPAVRMEHLAGGRLLAACDWPSVGQIDSSCTATLIGSRWILSAAHCPTGSRFRAGGRDVGITRCERHPDFASSGRVFDFMVCELDAPIDAPLVPLMSPCEANELNARAGETLRALPEGRPVFVVGLGAPASGEKRGVEMDVSAFIFSSPLIDFRDPLDVGGSRPGDSGGPTFLAMDDGTWRQVGVHHEGGVGASVLDAFVPAAIDFIETITALDTTPCHTGSTWSPSGACADLPSDLEGGGGTFPMCAVTRSAPTPTCLPPGDAAIDAGGSDAGAGVDGGVADAGGLGDAGALADAGGALDAAARDASGAGDASGDAGVVAPAGGCACRASQPAISGLFPRLVLISALILGALGARRRR